MARGTLTSLEATFVREYLIDLNAAAALRRAGSRAKALNAAAAKVMARPRVTAAIEAGMAGRAARLELNADRVVQELAFIAFSRMDEVAEWGPGWLTLRDSTQIHPEAAAAVASVRAYTSDKGTRVSIRLHDKVAALRLLMGHLGMKTEGSGEISRPTQEGLINMVHAFLATVEAREKHPLGQG